MKRVNHTENLGKKFGRLTVLEVILKGKYYYYNCVCDCGAGKSILSHSILNKATVSCGCYQKELSSKRLLGKPGPGRKPDGEASFNYLWHTYNRNAKKRNIEFSLVKEEFRKLTKLNCYYCGTKPDKPVKHHTVKRNEKYQNYYLHNGIDRLNNDLGYTLENSVTCCKICNVAKSTMSKWEFLDWVRKVAVYNELF